MKTSFIIAGWLFTGFVLYAQVDTTKSKTSNTTQNKNTPAAQGKPQEEKSFPTRNMVKVTPAGISSGLANTLKEEQYTGWEKGNLYFDKKKREYALLMPTLSPEQANMKYNRDIGPKKTPTQTGWYFFTEEGQAISN